MIKILQASSVAEFTLRIAFSDGAEGVFEGAQLLARAAAARSASGGDIPRVIPPTHAAGRDAPLPPAPIPL